MKELKEFIDHFANFYDTLDMPKRQDLLIAVTDTESFEGNVIILDSSLANTPPRIFDGHIEGAEILIYVMDGWIYPQHVQEKLKNVEQLEKAHSILPPSRHPEQQEATFVTAVHKEGERMALVQKRNQPETRQYSAGENFGGKQINGLMALFK